VSELPPSAEVIRAIAFAAGKHRDQRRKGRTSSPYINHPIELARVLAVESGINDPLVLCSAILHDTIEDTETTAAELASEFGPEVSAVVLEVTDDKTLEKHLRKQRQIEHAPHASHAAKLVKLADKICNLRDILEDPPPDWSLARKLEYFDWAARVIDGLRGAHPQLEALFDAEYARKAELG
jgi:GTP diphosphokinase / guanosine-3',5'-bis(diphosphate) 3'-diphosphatase